MIIIYTLDSQDIFAGAQEINPMAALPRCTLTPPPATTGTEVAQWQGSAWTVLSERPQAYVEPIAQRQHAAWERIKAERDRRAELGVNFDGHWYHSDVKSRIQQMGLAMMGAAVPPVPWKTLTLSGAPVHVTMTPAIAGGIFQGTAASDMAIFAAAETHRVVMAASATPESYDFSGGWPVSIEDGV